MAISHLRRMVPESILETTADDLQIVHVDADGARLRLVQFQHGG